MSKTKCSNCDKEIETNIFFLHERFCSLNVRKCSICNEPIQKDEYEEHKLLDHPKPKCTFCHLDFPNSEIESHLKICPKKLYECQYCGLYMNKNELNDHEYQCGSKTIKCEFCGENVTKTTYDLHLEYTCEKFNKEEKNSNKENGDYDINNRKKDNEIDDIINKNKKSKNKKEKKENTLKIGVKKRKRSNNEDKDEDYKPKKKKHYEL